MIAAKLILFFLIILSIVIINGMWYYCGYRDGVDDAMKAIDDFFAEEEKKLEKEHTEKQ